MAPIADYQTGDMRTGVRVRSAGRVETGRLELELRYEQGFIVRVMGAAEAVALAVALVEHAAQVSTVESVEGLRHAIDVRYPRGG